MPSPNTTPYPENKTLAKMEGQNSSEKHHQNAEIAVVMVPFPAQGHLNQFLHLSHHITSYQIPVHYVGPTTQNHQAKVRLHGRDPETLTRIHFHDFELPPYSSPPPDPNSATQFPAHLQPLYDASLHLRQPVYRLLQDLSAKFRRVVVIHDIPISSVVQDVKSIPNAEAYALLPISAFTMFLGIWEGMTEKPFQIDSDIPTCHCLPSNEGSSSSITQEIADFMEYQYKFQDFQSGKLYNTNRVIEGKYVELLERLSVNDNLKHFAIGPFHPVEMETTSDKQRHGCLEWLDKQDHDSVIYVSFGSSTTMNEEQIKELAFGLERSGQKFIWALRDADKGDVFAEDGGRKPKLPEGYEDRVRNRGLVVRDWAPQLEILAHPSIGGFMSHCGWNSCLESITMGVPIAAWPMHSDQPRNAIMVTEVLGIGTMVRDWTGRVELVTSNTIENAVTKLMALEDGVEMRKRAAKLGEAVRGSVAKDGASRLEMESFIAHITR